MEANVARRSKKTGQKNDSFSIEDYNDIFKSVLQEAYAEVYTPEEGGVVDIITFCEKFLNIDLKISVSHYRL